MDSNILQGLVKSIELKDLSTAAHTWRVVLYTRALAERARMPHEFIERVTQGAALHDVGKIDIPDAILQKPGRLTPEEFAVIRRHAALGYERLQRMGEEDELVLNLVRHHHERVDGSGYPDRLAGEAIPTVARYFAVIDSFDAMTSVRPYRRDIGEQAARRALAELESEAGTRYCAHAVQLFADLYRDGAVEWILHHFNDETCELPTIANSSRVQELHRALGRQNAP